MSVEETAIEAIRRFNRTHTRRIGVLGERTHGAPFSLTEARVLYETGTAARGISPGELARRLDVDAGHLTRVTRSLEARGFIERREDPGDGRKSLFDLTSLGREALSDLEARAGSAARALLAPLSEAERTALTGALATVERILNPTVDRAVTLRPPRPGDWGWIISRHGALYAEERGWSGAFERFVARVVLDFASAWNPDREMCLIAEIDGANVGSIALARGDDDETAKLRLLLVDPAARGMGLGRRLVEEATGFARRVGYRRVTLWTMAELREARHIYEKAGFAMVSKGVNIDFGREMIEEVWSLRL